MAPGRVSRSASTASRTFTFLPCVPANSHSSSTARHHQGASSSPKDASRTSSIPPAPRSSTCHVETVPSTDVLTNQGNRASGSGSSSAASASTAPRVRAGDARDDGKMDVRLLARFIEGNTAGDDVPRSRHACPPGARPRGATWRDPARVACRRAGDEHAAPRPSEWLGSRAPPSGYISTISRVITERTTRGGGDRTV